MAFQITAVTPDADLEALAKRITYTSGISPLYPIVLSALQSERRIAQLEARIAALEGAHGTAPHMANVERRFKRTVNGIIVEGPREALDGISG